jgi:hypothetical protein
MSPINIVPYWLSLTGSGKETSPAALQHFKTKYCASSTVSYHGNKLLNSQHQED